MFPQFRARYPKGCLTTELTTIHEGQFVVKAVVQVEGITLATGLAASSELEQAEDRARARALQVLGISGSSTPGTEAPVHPVETPPMIDALPSVKAVGGTLRSTPEAVTVRPSPVMSQSPVPSNSPETTAQTVTLLPRLADSPLEDVSVFPEMEVAPLEPEPEPEPEPEKIEPSPAAPMLDVAEIITLTTVEMKRLGWTDSQGRDYLMKTYGKKSRYSLNDEELAGFLQYLQTQPTPD